MNKSRSELFKLKTFKERFEYLKIGGNVGKETFGNQRYLNQLLYRSKDWERERDKCITECGGRNMGLEDYDIIGSIEVHHINPITAEDILNGSKKIFDQENLVCVTPATHKAIHYGVAEGLAINIERHENDTSPWKKGG